MIRMLIKGTRRQAEVRASRYGIVHIELRVPEGDEGVIGQHVVGLCGDEYVEQVGVWFNDDPAETGPGGFAPGSMLWFKNAPEPIVRPRLR